MQRVIRLLLCAVLLVTPALALGQPARCSMRSGQGIRAASCCGPVCHCRASRHGESAARELCVGQCSGSHGSGKAAPAAGTLVRVTVESLSDPVALAAVHPAAAHDPLPDASVRLALEPDGSGLLSLHGHALELSCTRLI